VAELYSPYQSGAIPSLERPWVSDNHDAKPASRRLLVKSAFSISAAMFHCVRQQLTNATGFLLTRYNELMDRPPPILQYTQLGVPPPPKTPPKKKMQIVGWCLVCAPFILYSLIGVSISLSNLLMPGRGYRMGRSNRSTVTPISHGAANDVLVLVFAIAMGAFSIFVLYTVIRKVKRER
jgi:hypothetical protein